MYRGESLRADSCPCCSLSDDEDAARMWETTGQARPRTARVCRDVEVALPIGESDCGTTSGDAPSVNDTVGPCRQAPTDRGQRLVSIHPASVNRAFRCEMVYRCGHENVVFSKRNRGAIRGRAVPPVRCPMSTRRRDSHRGRSQRRPSQCQAIASAPPWPSGASASIDCVPNSRARASPETTCSPSRQVPTSTRGVVNSYLRWILFAVIRRASCETGKAITLELHRNQQSPISNQQLINNQRSPESTMLFSRSSPAGETAGSRCR